MSVIALVAQQRLERPEPDHVVDDGGAERLLLAAVQGQALLGHDLADQLEDLAIELVARQLGRGGGVDPVVERRLDPRVRALERFDAPIGRRWQRRTRRGGCRRRRGRPASASGISRRAARPACRAAGVVGPRRGDRAPPEHAHRLPSGQSRRRAPVGCAAGLPAIRSVTCWIAVGDLAAPVHHRPADIGGGGDRARVERDHEVDRPADGGLELLARDLAVAVLADTVGHDGDLAGRVGRRQQA